MNTSPKVQANRRFWLFLSVIFLTMILSFWSGFSVGREVEKQEWLELVNPPPEKQLRSS